jgi:hypothetical protein
MLREARPVYRRLSRAAACGCGPRVARQPEKPLTKQSRRERVPSRFKTVRRVISARTRDSGRSGC